MTVKVLKRWCKRVGVSDRGKKQALVDRLLNITAFI